MRLDPLRPERDVHLQAGLLLLQGHDPQAGSVDGVNRSAVTEELMGRGLRQPGEVDGLEREGRHQAATPSSTPSGPDSTSLRSSSGFDERVSAVAIVTRPARTSPASEVSMVCIPCAPPVWMSE